MHESNGGTSVFSRALRAELLISGHLLSEPPIATTVGVLDAASRLTEPWWPLALDLRYRRAVVKRVSRTLRRCMLDPRAQLRSLQLPHQHQPIRSVEEWWIRSVVTNAIACEESFPEAVRLATADALHLARLELQSEQWPYSLELAMVYDSMVLTSAYGLLHTIRSQPDARVVRTAGAILGHAALVSDRAE